MRSLDSQSYAMFFFSIAIELREKKVKQQTANIPTQTHSTFLSVFPTSCRWLHKRTKPGRQSRYTLLYRFRNVQTRVAIAWVFHQRKTDHRTSFSFFFFTYDFHAFRPLYRGTRNDFSHGQVIPTFECQGLSPQKPFRYPSPALL